MCWSVKWKSKKSKKYQNTVHFADSARAACISIFCVHNQSSICCMYSGNARMHTQIPLNTDIAFACIWYLIFCAYAYPLKDCVKKFRLHPSACINMFCVHKSTIDILHGHQLMHTWGASRGPWQRREKDSWGRLWLIETIKLWLA